LTLTLDPAIRHTVVHHSSTSTYIPNFIQIEETFCGRTDGHFSPYIIRSTFGSRPKYGDFGTPSISFKRFKLETSYLVHTLNMTCTSQRTTNCSLEWAWSGSCDLNLKFGTPS